jgi:small-conductance mechanosensitive channel
MTEEFEAQWNNAVDSLVAVGVALVELVIVVVVARFVHRLVRDRLLHRLDSPDLSESTRTAIGVVTTVVVGMAAITVVLALWGVTWSGIITAISVGTLGILLGVQDVLKSLIGGIFLLLEKPYSIGDRIQVRDITGRVIGIELRTTVIRSDDGHRVVAPNSIVFTDTLTNFSLRREIRTNLILTGIGGDPAELRTLIAKEVAAVEGVDEPIEVRIRTRRSRLKAPILAASDGRTTDERALPRVHEVWISWSGGGEPEVQAAVLARLHQHYPRARVRARSVKGTVAHHLAGTEHTAAG